jgi:hypothetical protein
LKKQAVSIPAGGVGDSLFHFVDKNIVEIFRNDLHFFNEDKLAKTRADG